MPRTAEQLRSKFETLKRAARKESADARNQSFQTGGGPFTEFKWDPLLSDIREIIKLSCVGLPSMFDTDVPGIIYLCDLKKYIFLI